MAVHPPDVAEMVTLHSDDEISPQDIPVGELVAPVGADCWIANTFDSQDRRLGPLAHRLTLNGVGARGDHLNVEAEVLGERVDEEPSHHAPRRVARTQGDDVDGIAHSSSRLRIAIKVNQPHTGGR